jgi:pyruvate dehydrogenase E1 component alpha subunit
MMAELYGKTDGGCGGKAGSMHLAAPEVGFMGSSAVVASSIPHAVGAALAAKRRRTGQVIVTVFGDGATEEGVFHEALNFAAKQAVPCLFVCENNGLAVHSAQGTRQAYDLHALVRAYGIPTHRIEEGYSDLAVFEKSIPIIERLRQSGGPEFVEIKTFRYMEHVGPGEDWNAGYRDRAALELWQKNDPLLQRRDWVERFTPALRAEIDEAVAYAEASAWPGEEALLTDVL